ncbi:hypothetical protein, partial [Paenibacillus lactis]|uniref:hypothetical protein n=1 Tax=Paenibacillus lactis TaxID=228574 RepID=UPI0036A447B6
PMVLGPKGPGRVGRRQANNHKGRYRAIDDGFLNIDVINIIYSKSFNEAPKEELGVELKGA